MRFARKAPYREKLLLKLSWIRSDLESLARKAPFGIFCLFLDLASEFIETLGCFLTGKRHISGNCGINSRVFASTPRSRILLMSGTTTPLDSGPVGFVGFLLDCNLDQLKHQVGWEAFRNVTQLVISRKFLVSSWFKFGLAPLCSRSARSVWKLYISPLNTSHIDSSRSSWAGGRVRCRSGTARRRMPSDTWSNVWVPQPSGPRYKHGRAHQIDSRGPHLRGKGVRDNAGDATHDAVYAERSLKH